MSILYPISRQTKGASVISPKAYAEIYAKGLKLPENAIVGPVQRLTKFVLSQGKYQSKFLFTELHIDNAHNFCFAPMFGYGAPALALQLEVFIALGVKKCIFLGLAGSLQEDVLPGDIVLCQQSVCADGTSAHYSNHAIVRPNLQLVSAWRRELDRQGQSFHLGRNWTTDAMFRETKAEIKHYQKYAVLTAEMEISAFLAVCRKRKIKGAAGVVVSDQLLNGVWKPDFNNSMITTQLRTLFISAQKTLLQES